MQTKRLRTVFCVLGLAVTTGALAQDKQPPAVPKSLSAENGRFVFGQVSHHRQDQFMIDTKTGRMWQLVERKVLTGEGAETSTTTIINLKPVPYSDATGKLSAEPK